MTALFRRRWVGFLLLVLLLLPLLLPMFTLQRGKRRILAALQAELGNPVRAAAVRLRLFPWPGFELDRVQMGDDPAFGAEPMATADVVIATLRLASLWDGRLEFSSIELDSPDLNLARNAAGYWNLARLLDRAHRRMPALRPSGARSTLFNPPPFPYLKIQDGRINFSLGAAKTRFYLDRVQADLELDKGYWKLHSSFVPERSDLNLYDTGRVSLQGRWQAGSAPFQSLPFRLHLRLHSSYLSAATALWLGREGPLDGIARADLRLQGTGHGMSIDGTLSALALRRHDLLPTPSRLLLQLRAKYDPRSDRLRILNFAPPGSWDFRLSGIIANLFTRPRPTLECHLNHLPVASLIPWARAFKSGLNPQLEGSGWLKGQVWYSSTANGSAWSGQVRMLRLELLTPQARLSLPRAQWRLSSSSLQLQPALATLDAASRSMPLHLSAGLDRRQYWLRLESSRWSRAGMEGLSRLWGVPPPYMGWLQGQGSARLDLQAHWSRFRHPLWLGEVRLRRGYFRLPDARHGFHLTSARLLYQPRSLYFSIAGQSAGLPIRVQWRRPRQSRRHVWFSLSLPSASRGALLSYFQLPHSGWLRNWLRIQPRLFWPDLSASGQISIAHLRWRGHSMRLQTHLRMSAADWQLHRLRLEFAGGHVAGFGDLRQGHCAFHGRASGLRLSRLWQNMAMHGSLSGPVNISWPHCDLTHSWLAQGMAVVHHLRLPAHSFHPQFSRNASIRLFTAAFFASPGSIRLSQVLWLTPVMNFRGSGFWRSHLGWRMSLVSGKRHLHLALLSPVYPASKSVTFAANGGKNKRSESRMVIVRPKAPFTGKLHVP